MEVCGFSPATLGFLKAGFAEGAADGVAMLAEAAEAAVPAIPAMLAGAEAAAELVGAEAEAGTADRPETEAGAWTGAGEADGKEVPAAAAAAGARVGLLEMGNGTEVGTAGIAGC